MPETLHARHAAKVIGSRQLERAAQRLHATLELGIHATNLSPPTDGTLVAMEPYRISGYRCPLCAAEVPLREFQGRLCCDECRGILIDEADYIAACADLAMLDLELAFSDEKPTTTACPRCERAMTSARAKLMPTKFVADVLRCDRDGLWFRDGLLAGVFARIGRRAGGAIRSSGYSSTPGPVGLDGIVARGPGPITAGLAISDWRNRKRRRAQTATPINLYKDQPLTCPVDNSELRFYGDRYACDHCAGTFVLDAAFEAMVMDISKSPWDLPPPTGAQGSRGCPVCRTAMLTEDIEQVPLDRCPQHGLWFDAVELRVTLERASGQFEPRGVRAWLERLFT